MFGFGGGGNNNNNNNGPPPASTGSAPQISAQQAAGLASAAYGVHQALPPEMKAKVNQYAADQATAYVHQKLGMPPPQSQGQAPGATAAATPSSGFTCLSLFGMGTSPPAPPASTSSGNPPTSNGGAGGMMDMASSFLSFGAAPNKQEPQEDPNSFSHLWKAAGPEAASPPQHAQPASKPSFDFSSMFTGQQQQSKPVQPGH